MSDPIRVVLVEDNDMVRGLVETILLQYGYNVLASAGPAAAIEISEGFAGEIPLLVTDVVMPEMNGLDLAHHLMRSRPDLRTVYMSGYASDAVIGRVPAGMRYLQKPFTPSQLAAAVREMLAEAASVRPARA